MTADQAPVQFIKHADLTPQWDIFKASQGGHMRWIHIYTLGSQEEPPFPDDPTVNTAQVNVKLFSLAPYAVQPPHSHEEDIIFAVVKGSARFLEGPEGKPSQVVGPLDVVYVPTGGFYGSVNIGDELFQAWVIRLPRTEKFRAPYNLDFPDRASGDDGPRVSIPNQT